MTLWWVTWISRAAYYWDFAMFRLRARGKSSESLSHLLYAVYRIRFAILYSPLQIALMAIKLKIAFELLDVRSAWLFLLALKSGWISRALGRVISQYGRVVSARHSGDELNQEHLQGIALLLMAIHALAVLLPTCLLAVVCICLAPKTASGTLGIALVLSQLTAGAITASFAFLRDFAYGHRRLAMNTANLYAPSVVDLLVCTVGYAAFGQTAFVLAPILSAISYAASTQQILHRSEITWIFPEKKTWKSWLAKPKRYLELLDLPAILSFCLPRFVISAAPWVSSLVVTLILAKHHHGLAFLFAFAHIAIRLATEVPSSYSRALVFDIQNSLVNRDYLQANRFRHSALVATLIAAAVAPLFVVGLSKLRLMNWIQSTPELVVNGRYWGAVALWSITLVLRAGISELVRFQNRVRWAAVGTLLSELVAVLILRHWVGSQADPARFALELMGGAQLLSALCLLASYGNWVDYSLHRRDWIRLPHSPEEERKYRLALRIFQKPVSSRISRNLDDLIALATETAWLNRALPSRSTQVLWIDWKIVETQNPLNRTQLLREAMLLTRRNDLAFHFPDGNALIFFFAHPLASERAVFDKLLPKILPHSRGVRIQRIPNRLKQPSQVLKYCLKLAPSPQSISVHFSQAVIALAKASASTPLRSVGTLSRALWERDLSYLGERFRQKKRDEFAEFSRKGANVQVLQAPPQTSHRHPWVLSRYYRYFRSQLARTLSELRAKERIAPLGSQITRLTTERFAIASELFMHLSGRAPIHCVRIRLSAGELSRLEESLASDLDPSILVLAHQNEILIVLPKRAGEPDLRGHGGLDQVLKRIKNRREVRRAPQAA